MLSRRGRRLRKGRRRLRAGSLLAVGLATLVLVPTAVPAGFRTIQGNGARAGSGKVYRYEVKVERSIGVETGHRFAAIVETILSDDRSWIRSGAVAFRRVSRGGNSDVFLARPDSVDRLCHPLPTNGRYSCTVGSRVVINLNRWKNAVGHWPSSLRNYRRMLVNHEIGHRIGQHHRSCPGGGELAPVMQQQSKSLQGCRANWWPKPVEIRSVG